MTFNTNNHNQKPVRHFRTGLYEGRIVVAETPEQAAVGDGVSSGYSFRNLAEINRFIEATKVRFNTSHVWYVNV